MVFIVSICVLILFASTVRPMDINLLEEHFFPSGKASVGHCMRFLLEKYLIAVPTHKGRGNLFQIYFSTKDHINKQEITVKTIQSYKNFSVIIGNARQATNDKPMIAHKVQNYIAFIEHPLQILRIIDAFKGSGAWNPEASFMTVIEDPISTDDMVDLFNQLRVHKIYDAFLLISNKKLGTIRSYTWLPYSADQCSGMCKKVFDLDYCIGTENVEIHPNSLSIPNDLFGCPLRARIVVSEPYVMPPVVDPITSQPKFLKGFEVMLLRIIAKKINLTLDLQSSMTYASGKKKFDHKNELLDEKIDLVAGWTTPPSAEFDYLDYGLNEHVIWCVPKATPVEFWMNIKFFYEKEVWLTLFLISIFQSIVFQYFRLKERTLKNPWSLSTFFVVVGMQLGFVTTLKPKMHVFRAFFIGWLLIGIVNVVIIQCFLRNSLIRPRLGVQIDTFEDIVAANLGLTGHGAHVNVRNGDPKEMFTFAGQFNDCVPLRTCIVRTVTARDTAVLIQESYSKYYENFIKNNSEPSMHCFNKLFFSTYYPRMTTWKHFPPLENMQKIATDLFENGLLFKWSRDVLPLKSPPKDDTPDAEKLNMDNINEIFYFLLFSDLIAFLVFCAEHIRFIYKNKRIFIRKRKIC